jgi:hypothetical protein
MQIMLENNPVEAKELPEDVCEGLFEVSMQDTSTHNHSLTHSPPNIHHTHTLFVHAFTGDRGAARRKGPPTSDAQTLYQARP